jgi:hypothetical protein
MLLLRTSLYQGLLSPPHVVCARHLIIFIFFSVLAFVFLMCSTQFILVSNVKSQDAMLSNLFDFLSSCPYIHFGSGDYWKFPSAEHDSFGFLRRYLEYGVFRPAHLIIIFIAFYIRIVATRWCWCVVGTIQSSS